MTDASDDSPVPVIFKRELQGRGVYAAFPTIPATEGRPDHLTVYAHVGQHSAADMGYVASCKPAHPSEYADLKAELESIGYRLKIVRRMRREHYTMRKAELNAR